MNPTERARLAGRVAIYGALAVIWAAVAHGVIAPRLAAGPSGPMLEALVRFLHVPPMPFLVQDTPGRWREFSGAVLLAMAIHFGIATVLAPRGDEGRWWRLLGRVQSMLAMAFLAVAVLAPRRQDYFFYLEMWYHVRHGNDPWFMVIGKDGPGPLNAYGPLFNLLAFPAGLNTLAPRLILGAAYILFAIAIARAFEAGRPPSIIRAIGWLTLLWNPYVWVEVAFYGHFDVLVGLACLGAARAWNRGSDVRAGLSMAAGVLLKYLPIGLLPFLALEYDRPRPRTRFLAAAIGAIAAGMALSVVVWGPATFRPLTYAATRPAAGMSIYRFLHSRYSPLGWLDIHERPDDYAVPAQLLALWAAWRWSRSRKPGAEAAMLVAATPLVMLYRVGYPQYQMVPFIVAAAWLLGHWDRLRHRILPSTTIALYFGWIAACDVVYMLSEATSLDPGWSALERVAGGPILLLGLAMIVAVALAAPRCGQRNAEAPPHTGPDSCSDV